MMFLYDLVIIVVDLNNYGPFALGTLSATIYLYRN